MDRDARAGHRDRPADPGAQGRALVRLHGGQTGGLRRTRGPRGAAARGAHGPALGQSAPVHSRAPRPRDRPRRTARPGRPRLRAIWTPGHTPGHVCLHLEEAHPAGLPGHGRLFSGDHLLPRITPHIGLYEDPDDVTVADPLGDYLDSLERVGRLDPAEVLPAHQHAFTDAPGRVRELLTHHEERLTGLLTLLATPLTAWQLAERMEWNRPWEQIPFGSRNIAVSEAEAHVRRLVKLGRAEAVAGSGPVTYVAV
ncbi:MBL fold metallo-hydrolase [Streptomyces kaempferi]